MGEFEKMSTCDRVSGGTISTFPFHNLYVERRIAKTKSHLKLYNESNLCAHLKWSEWLKSTVKYSIIKHFNSIFIHHYIFKSIEKLITHCDIFYENQPEKTFKPETKSYGKVRNNVIKRYKKSTKYFYEIVNSQET